MTLKYKVSKVILVFCFLSYIILPQRLSAQEMLGNIEYFGIIQQKINSNFIYPPEAQIKGWEGIAKVRFTIAQDGRIKEIDIAESSGYPLLDAMAILAVKDAGPYPFPEDYYTETELELVVPVQFIYDKLNPVAPEPAASDNSALEPETIQTAQPLTSDDVETTPAANPDPASQQTQPVESEFSLPPPDQTDTYTITITAPDNLQEQAQSTKEELQTLLPQNLPSTASQDKNKEGVEVGGGEVESFIELSLKNHEPTKVAREEIELAEIKVTESKRGFFPGFKMQGYNTTGEVNKVDYEEREIKTQVDQPLYDGGKLKDTFEQAKVNLEITVKNYDRVKLDVRHKTETAYYNLIAARINLKEKESIYKEGKELLDKVEKLYNIEMVTPLELAGAQSWAEQISFQLDSIKQEAIMAELTFKQVLNIKEEPVVTADTLEAKKLDLDLKQCTDIALKNRPELELSELLVKFGEYGQRIESEKSHAFTVDLTGSYGWYEGHFKTEPWRSSTNWFGGVKVSKPWGGNTINTSYNSEHIQPRFGQTSPTASSTVSGEFNMLDNVKRSSDKKKSDIDLHRSLSDFDETIKTVIFEVQDAFLNYKKAILQLHTAEMDIKFRRNEVEVAKMRALVGEAAISSALESLFSLSDAQSKYIQALANYNISLASLKKASGYGLQI